MADTSYLVLVLLAFLCAGDADGQSSTTPQVLPTFVNAINLQDDITFTCEIQAVIGISEDDVFWYKLSRDVLSQLPPNGTSCGGLMTGSGSGLFARDSVTRNELTSGSGSGLTAEDPVTRNKFNITGDIVANRSYSLTLNPIEFGDEGYYACVVLSGDNQECFSNYVTVVVAPTGSVSVTPDNKVFEQNTTATLTCNSQGGPDNKFTWEIDEDRILVSDSHQLSVLVNVSSGGNYTCTVTNDAGQETDSTMLFVHPLITEEPEPFTDVTNGTNIGIICDADSFPEPMYQWIRPNGLMVRDVIVDTNRPNILGFNPALFGDEGVYICRAFITINELVYDVNSTKALLTLSPQGTVEASPDIFNGVPGGNASFNCSSLGGPRNTFKWMRLPDGINVGNESTLTLTGLDAFDGGQYQCFVENRAGNDTTVVTLYIGPAIDRSPLSQKPTLLESFSLSCTATGFPSQNVTVITWFHNDTIVGNNTGNVNITTQTPDIYTISSTLTIASAQAEDSGDYYCVASSQIQVYANVSSETAEVFVLNTPERPQDITASDIQSRSLLLTWVEPHDNNAPIQGYFVLFYQPNFVGGMTVVLNVTETAANVTDLYPGVTYNFTVIAFNEVGNSSSNVVTQFRTLEEVPSSSPQNVSVYVNSSTKILVTWGEVSAINRNGIIIDYEVLYEPLETFEGQLLSEIVNSTEMFIYLTGLQEFVSYNISVRASTSAGPGSYSEEILAMTLEDTPNSPPVNVSAKVLSPTTVEMRWEEIPAIDRNGIINIYEIVYESFDGNSTPEIVNVTAPSTGTNLTGLEEYMRYNISVRAYTSVGPGPYSTPLSVITDEDAPSSAPENVIATVSSPTQIFVTWEEVPLIDQNGNIITYEVLFEPQVTFDGALVQNITNTTNMSLILVDLHPFVNYIISVRAYTSVGAGPYQTVIESTSEDRPASFPENVTTNVLSSTSILVSWEEIPPFDQNGIIIAYEVFYEPLDTFDGQLDGNASNTTELSIMLSGLEEFLDYNITIRVYTDVGPGPLSNAVTDMTQEDLPSSSPVNVESEVLSSTSISVSWEEVPPIDQNGMIIEYEVLFEPLETFGGILSPSMTNSTDFEVVIMNLTAYVSYTISVRAYTSEGSGPYSEVITNRTLEEAPDVAPGNVVIDALNSTSLIISWEEIPLMNRNGIITIYEVLYVPLETFEGRLMPNQLNTSNLDLILSELQEFVEYNVSVRAYTSVGPGPYSDEEIGLTLEDRPASPPENVETMVISSTSIMVMWNDVSPIDQNGDVIEYEVQYIPLETFGDAIGVDMVNTSDQSYLLDSLEEFVIYNISVRGYTTVGSGPYSDPIMNQTFEDLPASSPINVSVEVLSSTSIMVTWDEIPLIDQNGIIIAYEVLYEPLANFNGTITESRVNTSNISAVLMNLEEFVNYSISVRGYTSVGPGNYSVPIIVMTEEDIPAVAPINVQSEVLSSTSINVTWAEIPPIRRNGIITEYEVLYEPLETFGGDIGSNTVITSNLFYVLEGLQEYVDYNISVRAYTSVGFGPYSEEITNRTFQDLPASPPDNVTAEVLSSTSILVSWEEVPSIDQNGVISTYEILLEPLETFSNIITERQINSTNFSAIVSDLKEFLNYSISVRAYTIVGPGNYSDAIVRMTLEDVPAAAPLNVVSQVLSPTSINISWDVIPPIDRNGIITMYEVLFVPFDIFNGSIGAKMENTTDVSYSLVGLQEYVIYNISVRAYTNVGFGPYTVPITNQTLEDTPSSSPINIVAVSQSSTSINVSWEEVPPIDQNGIIITYEVCYEPLETFDGAIMKEKDNTSELFYLLSDLEEFVNYTITIRAYTSEGSGPYSDALLEMTQPDRPRIAPLNVVSEVNSSTSIYVTWEAIPLIDRNGNITAYEVLYEPLREDLSAGSNNTTSLDFMIMELEEFVHYNISVRAFTTVGPGPYSVPITNQTFEDVPGPVSLPPEVNENEITSTSAILRWSPPNDPNGVITSYRVKYVVMSSNPGGVQGGMRKRQTAILPECIIGGAINRNVSLDNVTMVRLTGLTPYSEYSFQVAASTKIGEGPELSDQRSFTTKQDISSSPRNLVAEYVSIENASSTSLQLMWDHPQCDYGVRTGYTVTYMPVQREEGQQSTTLTNIEHFETRFILSSLTPNTNYTVIICARTVVGCGNTTMAVGLTNEDAPYEAITLEFNSVELPSGDQNRSNSVNVEFRWTKPSDRNGSYYFELEYSAVQNFDGGRNIALMNTSQISGDQQTMQFNNGLPYAMYEVRIFAYNIKRGRTYKGQLTNMSYRSISIIPTPVNNLTAQASNFSSILVKWSRPTYPNGPISNYTVYYREANVSQNQSISDVGFNTTTTQITEISVTRLKPYTNYTFHVRAILSTDMVGDADTEIVTRTHGTTPEDPVSLTISPIGPSSSTIQIQIPDPRRIDTGNVLTVEIVVVRNPTNDDPESYSNFGPYTEGAQVYITATWNAEQVQSGQVPRNFTIGDISASSGNSTYKNNALKSNTLYGYFIRYKIENDADAEKPHYHYSSFVTTKTALPFSVPGLVIGLIIIITVITASVIVIAIFIIRKHKRKTGSLIITNRDGYMMDPIPTDDKKEIFNPVFPNPLAIGHNGTDDPILIEDFADHVKLLHANDDYLFTEEYSSVEPTHSPTTEATRRPENISKNRYANITSYDHSRVRLLEIPGVPGSDYINANFLDGYDKEKAFIATQGPVPGSVSDFWRMVWEQGTAIIVMVTNLEEKGRVKCFKYWPDERTQLQGNIRIVHQETLQLADYTVRTFSLQRDNSKEERIVRQFHFTVWPDHGVPEYPSPLLGFVRKVMNSNPNNAGPMVVHCSAGVGRTGTFITLVCELQQMKVEGTLNIFGFVSGMRRKRCFMVQTESQYVFIHDALLEVIDCGETEVLARRVREEYRKLGILDMERGQTGLEIEFIKLQSSIRINPMKSYCHIPSNKPKNRYTDMEMLPYDKTRVKLRPSPGVSGSDYINASHIDGYHKRRAFIATQAPLPDTTEDFWRMVWEQDCATIVMLTKEREGGRVKCHKYWPDSGAHSFSNLQVILHAVNEYPDYVLREFKIVDTRDDSSIPVKQFQYTGWPEEGVPDVGSGLIDVIGQVQKWQRSSGDRPIVVHCSGGCGRTGTYIAISILLERMKTEGVVDVFQTARTLRLQRPGMIQSVAQYEFCYKTVLEFLVSFDTYANFK